MSGPMIIRTASVHAGEDLDIAYRPWGSSRFGRLPIVAVHGDWSTSAAWTLLAGELTERWIVAPDLRGRGRTKAPDNDYRVPELAADLRAFLDGLDLRQAHFVGHELGAAVVAQLALEAPERVASLSLIALPSIDGSAIATAAAEQVQAWKGDSRAFSQAQSAAAPKAKRDMLWATLIEAGHKQRLSAALAKLEALADWKPGDRLAGLTMPRTLIVGELDEVHGGAQAERAAAALGCPLSVIPGVGQLPALEAPETLADLIRPVLGN